MKNFIIAAFAVLALSTGVSAQQVVLGTGAFSGSSSGISNVGNVGSGAAFAGVAGTNLHTDSNQMSSGVAVGVAGGGVGFAATQTTSTGTANGSSTSFALGLAAASSTGSVTAVNGSDASAFGGFGITFP